MKVYFRACIDCPDRRPACQGTCEAYLADKAARDEEQARISKARTAAHTAESCRAESVLRTQRKAIPQVRYAHR